MFRHAVVNGIGNGETTVVISGDAVFTDAQEMQSALSEALEACDHLVIDVGGVVAVDLTFRALLCSLHRRSELVNKRISMQGALPRREDDRTGYARVNGCLFKGVKDECRLWKTVMQGGEQASRKTEGVW